MSVMIVRTFYASTNLDHHVVASTSVHLVQTSYTWVAIHVLAETLGGSWDVLLDCRRIHQTWGADLDVLESEVGRDGRRVRKTSGLAEGRDHSYRDRSSVVAPSCARP